MISILSEEQKTSSETRGLPASQGIALDKAQKPSRVLLWNISWMLVGNFLYGLSQWAQLMALAKLGTIDMVGTFALALAICLPVLMFSSLSLRSLQITDYQRKHRFLEYVTLRLLTLVLSLSFIVLFAFVTGNGAAAVAATILISAAKSVEYISDILYGSLQKQEDMSGIAVSMILRAILSVTSLSITVYVTHSLIWGATAMLIASTLVLLCYDVPKTMQSGNIDLNSLTREFRAYGSELTFRGGHRRLSRLALSGLPMGFVMMLVSLNLNIPRYFIQQRLGTHDLAIFSAIATLLTAGSVVTNAIGQAAAPRLAKCFANRDMRGFLALLSGLVLASLGLGAGGFLVSVLFGKQAMALMYRPEYTTRQDVLVWLMAASGFFYLGSTLGYAVTAVRCFAPQLPLFAIAAVTTAIACLVLVPSMGLRGVAVAVLISAVVQCAGSAGLLWNSCRTA